MTDDVRTNGRVLLFTRTTDYRHESIEVGVRALTALAGADGLATDHTEDPSVFTEANLARYEVVVWLSTSGDVLDDAQRAAFRGWLADGGSFVGIHGATTAEPGWPEFERIVGAFFASHPEIQPGTLHVEDPAHPSTEGLPSPWRHVDEWYDFRSDPRRRVHVLLSVDEASYDGGQMGEGHPIAWCHRYGEGRCWYTALGHRAEAYEDEVFLRHLRGGLRSVREDPDG